MRVRAVIAACLTGVLVHGAVYVVSPEGDDAGPGSAEQPFRTRSHAAGRLQPGDTCLIRGGTYRETVSLTASGTEEAPIRLASWPGETVVLDGTEPVPGPWTQHEGSIYWARCEEPVEQLFSGDSMLLEARWPNTTPERLLDRESWAEVGKRSAYGIVQDYRLAEQDVDWTGATAVLNINHQFFTWSRPVLKHGKGSDTFEYAKDMGLQMEIQSKWLDRWRDDMYYLVGKLAALDAPGEWFREKDSSRLYVWMPDSAPPGDRIIRRRARDYGLRGPEVTHVIVEGLHFFSCTFSFPNCTACVLRDCHLLFPEYDRGVPEMEQPRRHRRTTLLTGTGNRIERCSTAYSGLGGFVLRGKSNVIENSLVHDVCLNGSLHYHGIAVSGNLAQGDGGNVVRRCTVFNVGNVAVTCGGAPGILEYSHVHHGGLLSKDVSLVYTQLPQCRGTEFRYNWVHDSLSPSNSLGIRGDDQTRGLSVHHNVVWNCRRDAVVVKGDDNLVYNNTCFANGESDIVLPDSAEPEKVWRKQFPLLEKQNRNSLQVNNAAHTMRAGRRSGDETRLAGTVSHNHTGGDLKLADPDAFDFRPAPGSPLIDAGTVPDALRESLSFVGEAPDIGAYEAGAEPWLPGHRNGVRRISDGARRSLCLLMPVQEATEIHCLDDAGTVRARLRFDRQNWMAPQPLPPGANGVHFRHETWGPARLDAGEPGTVLPGIPSFAAALFERPDLTSARPFEAKFDYTQREGHGRQPAAAALRPVARAYRESGGVIVDGDLDEWQDGVGLDLVMRSAFADAGTGGARGRAGLRWLDDGLAVAVDIPVADPDALVREGGRWGAVMDGVEFDLASVAGAKPGPAAVLHGYPSGKLESVTDGGLSAEEAAAFLARCTFAAAIHESGWRCELRIRDEQPIGLDERFFNIGARVGLGTDGEWIGWAKPRGPFYDLASGGGRIAMVPAVSADAPNMIRNGDFESEDPAPWQLTNNSGKPFDAHLAMRVAEGIDGGWCIRLQCLDEELQKTAILKWVQDVSDRVTPGTYVLSFDVRIDELQPQGKDGMFCAYVHTRKDGKPAGNRGQQEYAITARSLPWTHRDCVIELPEGFDPSMVSLQLHRATGVVWIDNVALRRARDL